MKIKRLPLLIGLVLTYLLVRFATAVATEAVEGIDIMRLHERTAILEDGKKLLTVRLSYSHDEVRGPIGVSWGTRRMSGLDATLGLRYGLMRGIEISASLPIVFCREEIVIAEGQSFRMAGDGFGEVGFGVTYEVLREDRLLWGGLLAPSVILGVNYKSDSSRTPYHALGVDELPIGTGHKNIGIDLMISRVIDPIFVYGSGQYTFTLERAHNDEIFNPGNIFVWRLGMGFSANPWVSIGGGIGGSVAGKLKISGEEIIGSDQVLAHTFLNLTYTVSEELRFTVEATPGIAEMETDFALSGTISYDFNE